MREHLLVEQDPSKCLIGPELVRVFYACAKLAAIQSNIYSAPILAMNEMACPGFLKIFEFPGCRIFNSPIRNFEPFTGLLKLDETKVGRQDK